MIFTASELAQLRDDFDGLLPGTCNILAGTTVSDGMGGGTVTWGTATAGVACDVWRAGRVPEEHGLGRFNEGSELVAIAEYVFGMPHDTPVDEQNRVEFQGIPYNVIRVDDLLPDQVQLRVYVRKSETLE